MISRSLSHHMTARLAPGAAALLFVLAPADAALVVQPEITITHHVEIQPIRVRNSFGNQATFMGDSASEAYMKNAINTLWSQVGVRIDWLPVVNYTNDFAYNGYPADYSTTVRPTADLSALVNGAGTPPRNSNAIVVNLFFVDIVPGFSKRSVNTANGLAFIDANGCAIHIGSALVTWDAGRDAASAVIAHEIGHNLGLSHDPAGTNLMYSGGRTAEYLTASQQDIILTDRPGIDGFEFLQSVAPASNYSLWAATFGLSDDPADDDDSDNLPNGLEFLLSGDISTTSLPQPEITAQGPVWTLTKNPDAVADGFEFAVETSSTLGGWMPAGPSSGGTSTILQNDGSQLRVRLNPTQPSGFMRVGIEIPPALGAAAANFIPLADEPLTVSECADGCGAITVLPEE